MRKVERTERSVNAERAAEMAAPKTSPALRRYAPQSKPSIKNIIDIRESIMEAPIHSIVSLFDQLGLESTSEGIKNFIEKNDQLPAGIELHEAKFWNASQASFLKQVLDEDADWVEIVNQLDEMLR